ncbi:MAG: EFR1 family ferrodoxin [Clostridiales bacterium]|nr:EFR1 family ferrodoxin [Clostridiales bacterium]
MTGILYFSSTGNSLYIAQKIQRKLGGKIIYIPTYQGDGSEFEKIIVVTPIYSYGMPRHVFDLLPKLNRITEMTIVQNYGGMVGGADYYVYSYALQHGLNIKSVYALKMPENYTLDFTVPKFYLKSVLKSADKRIDSVIEQISGGEPSIPRKKRTKEAKYLKNKDNWHIIGERFSVNEKCVKCGKCVNVCPSNNIAMVDGRIEFSNRCVACLGCYHRCPNKAIVYLNRKKKDRYINPYVDESLIGKNSPE